jgi:hypothetical protein
VFARKLRLTLAGTAGVTPVPKLWLDQFFMRNFTGYSAFDETLPTADGLLEAGLRVAPEEIRCEFEKWLRGRRMIPPGSVLNVAAEDG